MREDDDEQDEDEQEQEQDRLEMEAERLPLRKEGINEGRWALLDYGEVIVHVLIPDDRRYYDLESFWSHGESRVFLPSVKLLERINE